MQRVRQQSATQPGKFQLMLQRSRRRRRRFVCSSQLRRRLRQQKVRREMQLKSFAVVAGDIKCHSPTATTRLPRTASLFAPDLGCGVSGGVATFCMPQSFVRLFMPSTVEMPPPPEENEQCECDSNRMPSLPETKNQASAEGGGNVKGEGEMELLCRSIGRSVARWSFGGC